MNENNEKKSFFATTGGRWAVTIVAAILIWGAIGILMSIGSDVATAIVAIPCIYFGWKALSRITPNVFLIMPVVGWLIYFLVKGILSVFVGVFVTPFQIGKMVSNAVCNSAE